MPLTAPIRRCIDILYTPGGPNQPLETTDCMYCPPRPRAGGYCTTLRFWFDLTWNDRVKHATSSLPPSHPDYVHINSLAFIIVILQPIAAATRIASFSASDQHAAFPDGLLNIPVLICLTDNSSAKAWANRVTTKSP
jgi:hypothetical protein